ncbi:NIF system FeS cluster assembly NifU N-terminal domain-containing protein [Plasmodiophora brassicae]|uniref:NIF system FeS cluster assembly NifU N-terminal domain-containing protein n=1 Tax=Plasmodiophora brassicae TaxID=37360 RepID=A0A0G4IWX6_PLABS|nr:hypothetical protein PBRA_007476 [Plasmodiophora brassicae]SPQ97094.1 unnamed protein product [Plasmodiophora brassicae]
MQPLSRRAWVARRAVRAEVALGHGKKLDEVLNIRNSGIAKHLSLPPVKLHCSMLAEDAIKSAVQDYRKKRDG